MTKTLQNRDNLQEHDDLVEDYRDFSKETLNLDEITFSEDELVADLCRDSLYEFVKEFWDTVVEEEPVWNWHIEYLCDILQEIAERVFRNEPLDADTTINISPGSTKTLLTCVFFPAWIWTHMPSARIASVSYAHDQAMIASSLARDLILSDKYQRLYPEIKLRDDTNAKGHYANTRKGYRFVCGIDGQILGKHFHFLIVDDPINPEQAASDAELKRVNRFMQRTLPSRKVNKKVTPTILIMQRLAENDPAGERLEKAVNGVPHRWICLPAELTDDVNPPECRKYYIDGLMDPVRLDAEVLDKLEKDNDYVYAGQYLQRPIPEGTAMFHTAKITLCDYAPDDIVRVVRAWDKAGSEGTGAYTVGFKMGVDSSGHYWILDVLRDRLDTWKRERLIKKTADADGKWAMIAVEQEPGSGGKHSGQYTASKLAGYRVTVEPVGKSDGDKVTRAYGFSAQVNAGNFSMVKGPWNRDLINEMKFFPMSKFKDQIDAGSLAFRILSGKKRLLGGSGVLKRYKTSGGPAKKTRVR